MRIESSVTSLSWIPSEAIGGMTKMPFETGVAHYDPPPPDVIEDIDALQRDGRFRFANRLTAWIEVEDGAIVGHGQSGGGLICSTLLQLGKKQVAFEAIALPDLHPEPEVGAQRGDLLPDRGRAHRGARPPPGAAGPVRAVLRPAGVDHAGPDAARRRVVVVRADRRQQLPPALGLRRRQQARAQVGDDRLLELVPARLRQAQPLGRPGLPGAHHRGGDRPRAPAVAHAHAGRRQAQGARRSRPARSSPSRARPRTTSTSCSTAWCASRSTGERLAEYGPGSMHGERAVLEGGRRTSTIRAVTACKLAVASADSIDRDALAAAEQRAPAGGPGAERGVAVAPPARLGRRAMDDVDAVVIGSGPNGLVAAALLARAGWRVTVLERVGGGGRGRAQRRAHRARVRARHLLRLLRAAALLAGARRARARPRRGVGPFRGARGRRGVARAAARVPRRPDADRRRPGPARRRRRAGVARARTGGGATWARPSWRQMLGPVGRAGARPRLRPPGAPRRACSTPPSSCVGPLEALCAERFVRPRRPGAAGRGGVARRCARSTIPAAPRPRSSWPWRPSSSGCPCPWGARAGSPRRSSVRSPTPAAWCGPSAEVTRVVVERNRVTGVETADGGRVRARRAVLADTGPRALFHGLVGGRPAAGALSGRAAPVPLRHGRVQGGPGPRRARPVGGARARPRSAWCTSPATSTPWPGPPTRPGGASVPGRSPCSSWASRPWPTRAAPRPAATPCGSRPTSPPCPVQRARGRRRKDAFLDVVMARLEDHAPGLGPRVVGSGGAHPRGPRAREPQPGGRRPRGGVVGARPATGVPARAGLVPLRAPRSRASTCARPRPTPAEASTAWPGTTAPGGCCRTGAARRI